MGSNKGQSSQNQQQTSTYTPNPQTTGYINSALQRAQDVSQLPFNIPVAPTAGFSQDQQDAFQGIRNAQGMAQPYFNTAAGYFTPQGAQQFLNPYAANVMANMKDVFGQQMSQTTGQLTQAAGGVGADRIAVGQSELAKQQDLAAGQTMSGLYRDAVSQAQGAGYGTAALGSASQNAAISGATAQLGAGNMQQQLEQARLNAPYQQQLAQAMFPYQQSQFFSGQVGALAPGLGGTTSGYGNGTATPAQPSPFSQILGAGVAGAGLYGQYGNSGGAKGTSGDPSYGMGNGVYGGNSVSPLPGLSPSDYGAGYAEGGEVEEPNPYRLPPGFHADPINVDTQPIIPEHKMAQIAPHVPQLNFSQPSQQQQGSGSTALGDIANLGKLAGTAMMFLKRGGSVGNPYAMADGGVPSFEDRFDAAFPRRRADDDVVNPGDPIRMPDQAAVDNWRKDTDTAMSFSPTSDDTGIAFPYAAPPRAGRAGGPSPYVAPSGGQDMRGASAAPAERDNGFVGSPWAALTAAGLGMMAGTSPFAGVNIGAGGMQGMKTLAARREANQKDETIDQATRRLNQEAKFHEDNYTRLTQGQMQAGDIADRPYRELTAAQKEAAVARDRPYNELTAAEKEAARRADRAFNELSAEQKAAGERADRPYEELTADQKERAKQVERSFNELSAEQKEIARRANRPYEEMTKAEQAAVDRGKWNYAGTIVTKSGDVHPLALNQNTGEWQDGTTRQPPKDDDKIVPKNTKNIDDADARAMAEYYVTTGDRSRLVGLGRSGEAQAKVQHFVNEVKKERNVSDEELATRTTEFDGRKAGQRTLSVQEARMGSAAFEAEGAIKLARGVIEKLPRTSFLSFNKLAQGYSAQTLNPDQTELYGRAQAIVNTYAAVMARGANITTDTARGHAEKLLNTANDPANFNRMLDTMLQEIEMAKHSPAKMREFYRKQYGAKSVDEEALKKDAAGAGSSAGAAAPDDALAQARAAIAAGKDRNLVMKRLQEHGIDPSGL